MDLDTGEGVVELDAQLEGFDLEGLPNEPIPEPQPESLRFRDPSHKRDRNLKRGRTHKQPSHQPDPQVEEFDDNLHSVEAYSGLDDKALQSLEEIEAKEVKRYAITTDGKLSFTRVCKKIHSVYKSLPHELHQTYRLWLLTKPLRKARTTMKKTKHPDIKILVGGNSVGSVM